mmetsp:Transcript_21310/g.68978  ORF Transcript_21310/g.68978 Transcript_21310/m.68978 type:complete len:216 (-) Transcript_21310:601-1248(-)
MCSCGTARAEARSSGGSRRTATSTSISSASSPRARSSSRSRAPPSSCGASATGLRTSERSRTRIQSRASTSSAASSSRATRKGPCAWRPWTTEACSSTCQRRATTPRRSPPSAPREPSCTSSPPRGTERSRCLTATNGSSARSRWRCPRRARRTSTTRATSSPASSINSSIFDARCTCVRWTPARLRAVRFCARMPRHPPPLGASFGTVQCDAAP